MNRSPNPFRVFVTFLFFGLMVQACAQAKADASAATPTVPFPSPFPSPTIVFETAVPTATLALPTLTFVPAVTLEAVGGNLFIRRGPDMAFNPIGALYKGTRVKVLARDVLGKWVQIQIPDSDKTGWVSVQTSFSRIEGSLDALPQLSPAEWPLPAYLRNCTHHRMYIMPEEAILPSALEKPDNEIWVYPGVHQVYDIEVPGDPEVLEVTVKEGDLIEIHEDGLGEWRKCP